MRLALDPLAGNVPAASVWVVLARPVPGVQAVRAASARVVWVRQAPAARVVPAASARVASGPRVLAVRAVRAASVPRDPERDAPAASDLAESPSAQAARGWPRAAQSIARPTR